MQVLPDNPTFSVPIPMEIRVFHPKTSPLLAKAFTEGQLQALGRHNITSLKSSSASWWENPYVRGLVLIDLRTQQLLGGVRIHIQGEDHPMPMMPALQKARPEFYEHVLNCSTQPKAEISGIWRSPKAPKITLARLLTSKAVLVAKDLGIKRLYGFAGHHSVGILEQEGFGYDELMRQDTCIPYPDDRYRSRVCFLELNQEQVDWAPQVRLIHHGFIAFTGEYA